MNFRTLVSICLFTLLCAFHVQAQTAPNTMLFVGASADPNGGVTSAAADIGGAKLVGSGTYLGAVAHLSSKGVTPFQLSTKIQFHMAQKVATFRGAPIFWTGEVGPDFSVSTVTPQPTSSGTTLTTPAANTALTVGYAVGSGPLVSIPLGKGIYLMPHAEMTKGSLQDLGWRGGILIGIGSD